MKKFLWVTAIAVTVVAILYFGFLYVMTYSEGTRAGELIKTSHKGVLFKTYEGELSQGISGAQIFRFSVLDSDGAVIQQLDSLQGQYVKLTYVERYRTFPWWGDTRYFVIKAERENSPFK